MKKIVKLLVISCLIFMGIYQVRAFSSDDMKDKYGIWCVYLNGSKKYYFAYTGSGSGSIFNLESNFDELGVSIESGRPSKPLSTFETSVDGVKFQPEIQWLTDNKILDSAGNFTCPTSPFGISMTHSLHKECGDLGCSISDISSTTPSTTTPSTTTPSTITSSKDMKDKYGIWCVYSNGSEKYYFAYTGSGLNSIFNLDSNFDKLGVSIESGRPGKPLSTFETDADGVKFQPEIQWLTDNKILDSAGNFTCPTSPFDTSLTHYAHKECGGLGCSISDISLATPSTTTPSTTTPSTTTPSTNRVSCGGMEDIPIALPIFTTNIINIIKIAVPIILIIMGMLDFGKAVVSSDEKGMKESQNKFIKRVIAAISIFLVVIIVQFVFKAINIDDTNEMASCIDCFINGDCSGKHKAEHSSVDKNSKYKTKQEICYKQAYETCKAECSTSGSFTGDPELDALLGTGDDAGWSYEEGRCVAHCEAEEKEKCNRTYYSDIVTGVVGETISSVLSALQGS